VPRQQVKASCGRRAHTHTSAHLVANLLPQRLERGRRVFEEEGNVLRVFVGEELLAGHALHGQRRRVPQPGVIQGLIDGHALGRVPAEQSRQEVPRVE
jgi:hypothetical protein